jgi:hypothetical protein
MNALLGTTATYVLAALGLWLLGGLMLRAAGALLAIAALFQAASTGAPMTAALSILGGVTWLAGHWLYAVRHHHYRSPLARRIFLQALPARLDPTRGWGVPSVPPECRR